MNSEPASPASIAALNRARDLDAQTRQGDSKLVFSLCGNVYECMSGLTDSTLNLEPAPRREHPNSRIGFGVQDAASQRHALLRKQDMLETIYVPQPVYHQPEGGDMQVAMMPGVFAGLQAQHPFQVMYAGRDKWLVGSGDIVVEDYRQESGFFILKLEKTILSLLKGWICVSTAWHVPSVNDYSIRSAKILSTEDLNMPPPPVWSINDDTGNWEVPDGTVLFPVAYVDANNGKRPLIQQSLTSNMSFAPTSFSWGLTGPRNLGI